ncbi:MAG: type II secretion system protein [Firmicutes bacterium]|nr:type II secretion system protein [Bacillota bacterium]
MKKGFTLVELLAVLSILGILAVIIIPSVATTIKNSRVAAYDKQLYVLATATEKWGTQHLNELPETTSNNIVAVDFETLYQAGEIASYPVQNPITGNDLEGCILISYNLQYKQYEYKYSDNLAVCDDNHYNND